jgi:hypothetical protein
LSLIRCILSIFVFLIVVQGCSPGDRAPSADSAAGSPDSIAANADTSSTADAACSDFVHVATLPRILNEASGIAFSHSRPGILWTHNDGSDPDVIFALDTLGRIVQTVRIETGFNQRDLEDIAVSSCGDHDCIYVADIGDNFAKRNFVRILRVDEPASPADSVLAPRIFPFRYPDGPHDAEAMFILPGERVFVITKGRNAPVALYRYPGPLRADTVTLEHVQKLSSGLAQLPDMVTAASATPRGDLIAVRTYSRLNLYTLSPDDLLHPATPLPTSLAAAHEAQGEGVTIDGQGRVFLVGEQGLEREPAPLSKLRCLVK